MNNSTRSHIVTFILKVLYLVFRQRHPGGVILVAGIALMGLVDWLVDVEVGVDIWRAHLQVGNADIPAAWVSIIYSLSIALIVVGSLLLVWAVISAERLLRRKVVLAIELRGLIDTADKPLKESVPARLPGARKEILVDVRDHLRANTASERRVALDELGLVHTRLTAELNGRDRTDVSVVIGGILPVPFLFLVGMLIDDEGSVTLMDWRRHQKRWSEMDGSDDDEGFDIDLVDDSSGALEILVCVSASYAVDFEGAKAAFPSLPMVHLSLKNPAPDTLWSDAKQERLTSQFLATVARLAAKGAKHLHIVLVVPGSLALRLGQSYDRRNLPSAVVYQYERSVAPAYPWGVLMPTHGIERACLVQPPNVPLVDDSNQLKHASTQ